VTSVPTAPAAGRLAENVMHFARVLRGAGMAVGPDRVIDALNALTITGLARRDDFYWTLASVFLDRFDQQALFDQAFRIFWRDPDLLARVMQLLLPRIAGRGMREEPKPAPRLAEALAGPQRPATATPVEQSRELDATLTWSQHELLQRKDFEQMTLAELAQARAALAGFRLWLPRQATRRCRADARGNRIDMRASVRAALRGGGALITLKRRSRTERDTPLVVLADVSGSMHRYTRMLLHFVHAIGSENRHVHTFTFGTRLTNITCQLRNRDVDAALDAASRAVPDWAGGTRIGACLAAFNRDWSRRVLGEGARVLLVSDGLDRDNAAGLALATERLQKSCRELIWLNPLLRYSGFEARAAGIKAMLPHVDAFMPVHNLASLADLAQALRKPAQR
jgi:uncharacterized protein with von Willebrand factor type A (vWA) domain